MPSTSASSLPLSSSSTRIALRVCSACVRKRCTLSESDISLADDYLSHAPRQYALFASLRSSVKGGLVRILDCAGSIQMRSQATLEPQDVPRRAASKTRDPAAARKNPRCSLPLGCERVPETSNEPHSFIKSKIVLFASTQLPLLGPFCIVSYSSQPQLRFCIAGLLSCQTHAPHSATSGHPRTHTAYAGPPPRRRKQPARPAGPAHPLPIPPITAASTARCGARSPSAARTAPTPTR